MRDAITQKAIDKAGGVNALARSLGIKSSSVAQWERVPPRQCVAVAAATEIPLHELRPDIYPAPAHEDAA